jgi:hypothetical protein
VVGLGLISYPLYLWHWPILSFIRITEAGHPSKRLVGEAIVLAFVLAWATYQFVERPIRARVSLRTPLRLVAIGAVLIAIGSASLFGAWRDAFGPRTPRLAAIAPERITQATAGRECRVAFPVGTDYCTEATPGLPVTTVLLGDSHAAHFLAGVGANFARRGEGVVHLGQTGCPPLFGVESYGPGQDDNCRARNEAMLTLVGEQPGIRRIILSFRGAGDIAGRYRLAGTTLDAADTIRQALHGTVRFLLERHKAIWLIEEIPELPFDVGECFVRPFSFERTGQRPCSVTRSAVDAQQARYRAIVADTKRDFPELRVFDPVPFLCDARECEAAMGGVVIYADRTHLTTGGSMYFADKFDFQ